MAKEMTNESCIEDNTSLTNEEVIGKFVPLTLKLVAENQSRIRAITELLQDKGVFTKEEYSEKLECVFERDYNKIISILIKECADTLNIKLNQLND